MSSNSVLIVDDEENTRKLIRFALEKSGYIVFETRTGSEALQFLTDNKPDLIILDIVMPDMDGYTLMKKIKDLPVMRNIPVIISSGKSGMREYFDLDDDKYKPNAFLVKPYKMKDLIETVKNTI
ncbi:MAG: response regulator [Elusimicrobia bacterium]|nr:response regulator [Elusimicrobiota bacterium]